MGVTLDRSYGRIDVAYLTGQGRATGDLYLEITRQRIQNGDGVNVINRSDGLAPLELRLAGFQNLSVGLNVPFTATTSGLPDSQSFSQIVFDPNRVLQEGGDGTLNDFGALPGNLPLTLDARIRAFPGRNSLVQLFVGQDAFSADTGALTFDAGAFESLNYSTTGTDPDALNRVPSRLSDFVRFSLANVPVADRPNLKNGYEDSEFIANGAAYVYFSGDNIALSNDAAGTGSIFQEVGPVFSEVMLGKWANASANGFRGTYDLRTASPPDFPGTPTPLVSVYGSFRDYTDVLSGGSSFEIVMLPNSGERYGFEGTSASGVTGRLGDIVALVRSGTTITGMYYGGVDLQAGTFEMFPIRSLGLDPADASVAASEIDGTVSGYLDTNGNVTTNLAAVRRFSFAFPAGTALPAGFAGTGTVTVLR